MLIVSVFSDDRVNSVDFLIWNDPSDYIQVRKIILIQAAEAVAWRLGQPKRRRYQNSKKDRKTVALNLFNYNFKC